MISKNYFLLSMALLLIAVDGQAQMKNQSAFKMSDYWPSLQASPTVRDFDNGQSQVFFTTGANTIQLADYVYGEWADNWHLEINPSTGSVNEIADDLIGISFQYDKDYPIIWGSTLRLHESQFAHWGNSTIGYQHYQWIQLLAHYDNLIIHGTNHKDVIALAVSQVGGGPSHQIVYYLKRNFGFIRMDYYNENWNFTASVQMYRSCQATVAGQHRCP